MKQKLKRNQKRRRKKYRLRLKLETNSKEEIIKDNKAKMNSEMIRKSELIKKKKVRNERPDHPTKKKSNDVQRYYSDWDQVRLMGTMHLSQSINPRGNFLYYISIPLAGLKRTICSIMVWSFRALPPVRKYIVIASKIKKFKT